MRRLRGRPGILFGGPGGRMFCGAWHVPMGSGWRGDCEQPVSLYLSAMVSYNSPFFGWSHGEGGSAELVVVPGDRTDGQSGGRRTHGECVPLTFGL